MLWYIYLIKKKEFLPIKQDILSIKPKITACKGDTSEECIKVREEMAMHAKKYLTHLTDMLIKSLEKIKHKITASEDLTEEQVEEIRGVSFGINTLEILLELNWVKPQGRKNVPGRPIQYVTTDDFLSHFNLQRLSDLPNLEELTSAGLIDNVNIDTSIFGTGKFYKEKVDKKKENIYSNVDDMLNQSLKSDDE